MFKEKILHCHKVFILVGLPYKERFVLQIVGGSNRVR